MQEINLYKLLKFYTQNWLLILSLTLLGLLGGVVYNQFIQKPMYKSNATLLFINPGASTSTQDATLLNNYVELFQSRRVLEPVMNAQKIGLTYEQLSSSVSAVNEKGTEVIKLSVSTDNGQKSQKFLEAAVESFKEQAKLLYETDKVQVVDNASTAESAYNVHKQLQLAIATGAGFALSLIVLFFIYDARGGDVKKRAKKQKVSKLRVPKPTKTIAKTKVKLEPKLKTSKKESPIKRGLRSFILASKDGLWIQGSELNINAKAEGQAEVVKPIISKELITEKPIADKPSSKRL